GGRGIGRGGGGVAHCGCVRGGGAPCGTAARRPTSTAAWVGTLSCAAVVIGTGAHTSHASARLEGRVLLLWVDAIHQLAAALWIGGPIHPPPPTWGAPRAPRGSRAQRFSP